MIALILIVVATLSISAMCSLFEATLYSTRVSILEATRDDPVLGGTAKRFLAMKRNIARPTAAIKPPFMLDSIVSLGLIPIMAPVSVTTFSPFANVTCREAKSG